LNTTTSSNMKKKTLAEMNAFELSGIAESLGLDYDEISDDTQALISAIKSSGKYNPTTEYGIKAIKKDGKKFHPTLGEYVSVIVHPTQHAQKGTSVFASIGLYTVEFQPGEEVSIPRAIAKFLKESAVKEHYYDPRAISENGNIGAHCTRDVPKYIVTLASEAL